MSKSQLAHVREHSPGARTSVPGTGRRRAIQYHVPTHPLAMTLDTVIEFTGLRRTALFDAMRDGRLPARKAGTRNIILYADLWRFLESLPARSSNE